MKFSFLVFALVFSLGIKAHASGTVLNGGDAVFCKAEPGAQLQGLYSLDYLATYDPNVPLFLPRKLEDSQQRIWMLLNKNLPELQASFKVFAKNFLNKDPHFTYVWEEANFGLIDIKDEDLVSLLPENCRGSNGKGQLIQAVVRQPSKYTGMPNKILFGYQPKVLKEMYENAPLQLSFLLVHEWLWEFTQNVQVVRRVDKFLHSVQFQEMSRDQIISTLRELNFVIPGDVDALLYDESCLPDPRGIAQMFPAQGEDPQMYIAPDLIGQVKTCGDMYGGTCVHMNTDMSTRLLRDYIGAQDGKYGIFLQNGNALHFRSRDGNRVVTNLECAVDLNTALIKCTNMRDADGNEMLKNREQFTGTMSRSCIRLVGKDVADQQSGSRGDFWRENTYVIYKRIENR
jgi:hypothetical protein